MSAANADRFDCCGFCSTERRDLYKCPRCSRFYCSSRCYRSRAHLQCSERFYLAQCEQMEGSLTGTPNSESAPPDEKPMNRPTTTFEEYMKQNQPAAGISMTEAEANPQIRVDSNEEIVFDSDDEPDYLTDVARAAADQFAELNLDELDRRLLAAGISSGIGAASTSGDPVVDEQHVMESLYAQLTAEERRNFARLADEIIGDGGASLPSCFRPPVNDKKSPAVNSQRKRTKR